MTTYLFRPRARARMSQDLDRQGGPPGSPGGSPDRTNLLPPLNRR